MRVGRPGACSVQRLEVLLGKFEVLSQKAASEGVSEPCVLDCRSHLAGACNLGGASAALVDETSGANSLECELAAVIPDAGMETAVGWDMVADST